MSDALGEHLAACRERGAKPEHLGEVELAWAASRGDANALRELEAMLAAECDAAARRVHADAAFADEVRQAVRVRLLVAAPRREPREIDEPRVRIAEYVGRGPLRGWLGVVALRVALNLRRDARPANHDLLGELVGAEEDPELRHLKQLYRAEFREALEAALSALPERQRALLRLHYVDGLRHVQLARLYDVHETTVARWVAQAASAVADDARRRLMGRLSLSASSLDSVARMVLSNLDLSIARVLGP
jgi:RNA polymerase sigma-70 factor (ECF subfamily)